MDESRGAWIALNLLAGLRPAHRRRLVEVCGGPGAVFTAPPHRLMQARPPERALEKIASFDPKSSVERELERASERGFSIVTPADGSYPSHLRNLPDPPCALYVQGRLEPSDDLAVAVVGSRKASAYGLEAATILAHDLAVRGVTVVSGLAIGADSAAHRAALEGGGRTLAVLGSGLDRPYPLRNRRLIEAIAGNGAVLSEYPLGTDPQPWHFPQRNRVIAGLALGTVVIEASALSGSLGTAREALESGREVFAVPGRIFSERSVGSNTLIRAGHARLVQRAADVIEELPEPWRSQVAPDPDAPAAPKDLPEEEARVLAQLEPAEPVHVDDLARSVDMDLGSLLNALLSLEMRRLVQTAPGGRYLRVTAPAR
jgi:DNA processing protein